MENETSKSSLGDFVSKNSNLIQNAEKFSVAILILGLILYFLGVKNTEFILIIGSVCTAIIYFLFAFLVIEIENLETTGILNSPAFINFVYKLTFVGLSIAAIAIQGLVLKNSDFSTIITVGGFTLTMALILSAITKLNDRSKIYNMIYYLRIISTILILFYLANNKYHWF
jgi:hypothetical protein